MTKSSNQFIKNTILKLLGAIGSEKEINKYIEKFSSPEQRFAVIKVGGSVVENDLENLISSLVFLNQVGLKPVILHGAGPMLSAALEEKRIDFSFINGQRVTSPEVRDVAHEVFKATNQKIVEALEAQGAHAKGLVSNVFQCTKGDPDLGYVGSIQSVNIDFVNEGVKILVKRSKTDQTGLGMTKAIPYFENRNYCPVISLKEWIKYASINNGKVFNISDKTVALTIQKYALLAGLDKTKYAGHSLRSGFATSTAEIGADERSIMAMTGHKTTQMVRRYIQEANLFKNNALNKIKI